MKIQMRLTEMNYILLIFKISNNPLNQPIPSPTDFDYNFQMKVQDKVEMVL